MNDRLEKLKEHLKSPEGKASMKEYFNKLAEKLEELFPKGEKCQCGRKLWCRSKSLSFNAFANIYLREALTQARADERRKVLEEIEKKEIKLILHGILLHGYIKGRKGKLYYQQNKSNDEFIDKVTKDILEKLNKL